MMSKSRKPYAGANKNKSEVVVSKHPTLVEENLIDELNGEVSTKTAHIFYYTVIKILLLYSKSPETG